MEDNFNKTTPNNGIWVESWYDDMEDTVLELLLSFLMEIIKNKIADVRTLLTPEKKQSIIYKCLKSGTPIPSVLTLL